MHTVFSFEGTPTSTILGPQGIFWGNIYTLKLRFLLVLLLPMKFIPHWSQWAWVLSNLYYITIRGTIILLVQGKWNMTCAIASTISLNEWCMKFHPDQCTVLRVTNKKKTIDAKYQLHRHTLESVTSANIFRPHVHKQITMGPAHKFYYRQSK